MFITPILRLFSHYFDLINNGFSVDYFWIILRFLWIAVFIRFLLTGYQCLFNSFINKEMRQFR